jgi:hypothetical protein
MHAPFELIFSHLSVDWDCRLRNRDRSPVPRRRIEFRAGRTIKEIAERTIRVFPAAASERQSSYAQARRPPGAGDSLSVSFDESMQQARVTTGFRWSQAWPRWFITRIDSRGGTTLLRRIQGVWT